MTAENERRIRVLLGESTLADQVMAIIHEDETQRRAAIRHLQKSGIEQAKANGVRLGRPPLKKPRKFASVYTMYLQQEITARTAAKLLGVSPGTFRRWVREKSEQEAG